MKKILVIAACDVQHIKKSTRCTLTAAKQLGQLIDLLLLGSFAESCTAEAACLDGVNTVLINTHSCYNSIAENISALIVALAPDYDFILAPASSVSKDFLPRLAAKLNVSPISDVIQIVDVQTFVRPVYAGNALSTVESNDPIKLMTIRASAFSETGTQTHPAKIEKLTQVFQDERIRVISEIKIDAEKPTLENARVVIAGGRALQSAAQFSAVLEPLAEKLHAAIGASRAAVDAKYASNDCQIGQTGKVIAPELYFAIGISGAPQHLSGIKDSKVIVAINQDPSATITSVADYVLLGDLFTLVPELVKQLAG